MLVLAAAASCSSDDPKDSPDGPEPVKPDTPTVSTSSVAEENASRAVNIIDAAIDNYFDQQSMSMSRYYNPYSGKRSSEIGSVWMYTSAIEAVNATLKAMKALKSDGKSALYDANWSRYTQLLDKLVDNADYYAGTFTLTSYTGTNSWTVYGVNRSSGKGGNDVTGVLNVYDDQEWLVRELVEAYHVTGEAKYLEKAEYLASYVLDGWDCTLDANGNENGGITWGPGYVTKHSCSNGPIVSPLVWLSDIYKGRADEITYRRIDAEGKRYDVTEKKADYYLDMAREIYDWQMDRLYDDSKGVFFDLVGGSGQPRYEEVDGVTYRAHTPEEGPSGKAWSYNTGSMLSGAADLARATGEARFRKDASTLAERSFAYFATADAAHKGCYTFDLTGFATWFNGVLMRAYAEAFDVAPSAAKGCDAFQANLDYGYEHHLYNNMLPTNLLVGWNRDHGKCDMEGMFTFTFASEYAVLALHELNKK